MERKLNKKNTWLILRNAKKGMKEHKSGRTNRKQNKVIHT